MRILRSLLVSMLTLVAFVGAAGSVRAAESYDNCAGFIDALPATITIQGTWCLRQDLVTAASSGYMIAIQTNNVTIDCNGFKLAGAGGGVSTTAVGIRASGQRTLAIRRCTIRGFAVGIGLLAGSGYLIEDNLLDLNRFIAIETNGSGSIVRRNIVTNTGGSPSSGQAYGIYAEGDVIDNVVDAVFGADSLVNFTANGIYSQSNPGINLGMNIQGNRIRNLTPKGTGTAFGISSFGAGVSVRDNIIAQASSTTGTGITCVDNTIHVRDNVLLNYGTGIVAACHDAGGNSVN